MIKKVDHIAIVVRNLDEALKLYENVFGIKPAKIETIPQQGVKAALLPIKDGGEIELLEPIDPQSGVAKFLETKGEGIHHICLVVDDVDKELSDLANKGVSLIDKQGRSGLAGKIGFIHPKSTKGVLFELAQKVPGSH
jgi:methylmalonyl-CoA epimerase